MLPLFNGIILQHLINYYFTDGIKTKLDDHLYTNALTSVATIFFIGFGNFSDNVMFLSFSFYC